MSIPVYQTGGMRRTAQAFFRDTLQFTLDRQADTGRFYRLRIPVYRLYVASDPAIMDEVLVRQKKAFRKSPAYRELRLALGEGLLTSEGELWRQQRRLVQPAFHRTALIRLYEIMRAETARWIDRLHHRVQQEPNINLSAEMMQLASDIALKTLFSSDRLLEPDRLARQIHESQSYLLWRVAHPLWRPFFPFLRRHRRFQRELADLDATIYQLITQRRQSGTHPGDLLDLLMSAEEEGSGQRMSDRQLRDEIVTLYVAGHETSANALAWAGYLLSHHREVQDQLVHEVQQGLAEATPTQEELRSLTWTHQVSQEVLRLYPPAHAIGRQTTERVVLDTEILKPGSITFLAIYAMHRDPAWWPDPHRFDPARFSRSPRKGTYLPFGAGPRMCVGAQFAQLEIPLVLSSLARHFEIIPVEQSIRPTGLITLKPDPPIRVRLRPRHATY